MQVYETYSSLKTEREQYITLWKDISRVTGITLDVDYKYPNKSNKSKQLDEYVDDPTSVISVNKFGDYLLGLMWGSGDGVFKLTPSRYVLDRVSESEVENFYDFATGQTLYHMNHSDGGYTTALRPYSYDQAAFGTSGIGVFPNKAFEQRIDDNALLFRYYGVDNTCIDEGKSGHVEIVFATYKWRVNRIVSEFCTDMGEVSNEAISKLPKPIREAWQKNQLNQEFILVFGMMPRQDYDPKLKGKKGTRYRGVWFMDSGEENRIFHEESFAERPISMARMIKIRGHVYGRSAGTMLLSTIRSVNFMMANCMEIIEKMGNPSLGIFNNALFGDSVLDTSPNGLAVFNTALTQGQNPVFPLYDVGDPSALIQILIPYLNEKITTAFKIDALLDFSAAKEMTATESLHRYAIRGKSLAGILLQQKNERLIPDIKRSVSILYGMGVLGANPVTEQATAQRLRQQKRTERIIPQAVIDTINEGRPWYDIRFNNELEKMVRTEAVQNLLQVLQSVMGIAQLYPQIIEAVNWYKLLADINNNLDANNQILYSAEEFKKKIEQIAQQQQAVMALQAGQAGAQINKDNSQATKNQKEADNVFS